MVVDAPFENVTLVVGNVAAVPPGELPAVELAQDKNITVSENEVDALYKDRITQSQSEEALLLIIRDMYGLNKSDYRNVLRQDILQEKVQASINMPLADWLNK